MPFTEGVHLLERPNYDAVARSAAVSPAVGDPPRFFPWGTPPPGGGKPQRRDPAAPQEKSVIKHKAPLNFLKWETESLVVQTLRLLLTESFLFLISVLLDVGVSLEINNRK